MELQPGPSAFSNWNVQNQLHTQLLSETQIRIEPDLFPPQFEPQPANKAENETRHSCGKRHSFTGPGTYLCICARAVVEEWYTHTSLRVGPRHVTAYPNFVARFSPTTIFGTMDLSAYLDGPHEAVLLRTVAYQCKPLIVSGPPTLKLKHLLYVIENASQCPVVAVEVYVYLTCQNEVFHRHFFVSKADTTGLGTNRASIAGVVTRFLQYLLSVSPQSYLTNAKWRRKHQTEADGPVESEFNIVNTLLHLSRRLKSEPKFYDSILYYGSNDPLRDVEGQEQWKYGSIETSISLFTRSAGAYLFPASDENTAKHVADGNELFKWWISVLLKTLDDSWDFRADIPGSDKREVARFFPQNSKWSVGSIYDANSDLAVFRIPVFPDDPKGRFLEHLVVEGRYKMATTTQFWNELGFRQEFRLGNTVGIIGCVQKSQPTLITGDKETVITLKSYKRIIESIKGESYNNKEEVQSLVQSGLPETYKRCGINVKSMIIEGRKRAATLSVSAQKHVVNDLDGIGQKRREAKDVSAFVKKKAEVNDLSNLVKKQPETDELHGLMKNKTTVNDLNKLVKKKPQTINLQNSVKRREEVNDLNGLVKRKKPTNSQALPGQERKVNELHTLISKDSNKPK